MYSTRVLPSSDVVRYEHRGCGDTSKQQYLTAKSRRIKFRIYIHSFISNTSTPNSDLISLPFKGWNIKQSSQRAPSIILNILCNPLSTIFITVSATFHSKPNCDKFCSYGASSDYLPGRCLRQKLLVRYRQSRSPVFPKPTGQPVKKRLKHCKNG